MTALYILISISIVSVLSLVGVFTLFIKPAYLDKIIFGLVSFAVGSLLGAAFLDILPEASETIGTSRYIFVLLGILLFFIVEKFLFWHHCHKKEHNGINTSRYMLLIGDAIHNFIDGMIIATAFVATRPLGVVTTIAIIMHEIPQELGHFGILYSGGFARYKALLYNFISTLTAFLGGLLVYLFSMQMKGLISNILPFAAGGFIYIACTDLMPELCKEINLRRSLYQFTLVFFGIGIIWVTKLIFE
jgi:zinc and cadmium transporter